MQVIYLNVFYTSVVLILPLIVVLTLNARVVQSLQESKRRLRHNSLHHYDGHSETNITIVMVAIVIELVLCHTPDRVLQVDIASRAKNPRIFRVQSKVDESALSTARNQQLKS